MQAGVGPDSGCRQTSGCSRRTIAVIAVLEHEVDAREYAQGRPAHICH